MKTSKIKFLSIFLCLLILGLTAQSEDLRKIVSLSGTWRFSIGDDNKWANPAYDDSGWDQLSVPANWESEGYEDYNGYAWYRKSFKVYDLPENTPIYLMLGQIDDADIVYINGKEIGRSGKFPPDYKTAYDRTRKYIIPAGILNEKGENVICVKVYDSVVDGGIVGGPVGIYFDEDNDYLNLNLSGLWKFQTGNNKDWKLEDFNDSGWNKINVPSVWENEGYEDYDGYAWYRYEFTLPQNFVSGDLYLSLGKIDDEDIVYLNGKKIGDVYDLKSSFIHNSFIQGDGWQYNTRRLYKIPDGVLIRTGKNIIAIKVYDGQGLGGIYEGPIGIMSADNYRKYKSKHHSDDNNNSFWDYLLDKFYRE
jgi:sialate O-acetylesterase